MKHAWEYRNRLNIHNRMTEVIKLTLDAARQELAATKRKLKKIQYGG